MIHTVKGFGIVSKAEVDFLLELSCFFDDPMDVANLTSVSSTFSKSSLNIWKYATEWFTVCSWTNLFSSLSLCFLTYAIKELE